MKGIRFVRSAAISLAYTGLLFPPGNLRADTPNRQAKPQQTVQAPRIVDVALGAGGTVTGRVIDDQGIGIANAVVSIRQGDQEIAKTLTDKNGLYVVNNLRGGVYDVVAAGGRGVFRFWAPETAPPSGRDVAIVVSGSAVVRGQLGWGLGGSWMGDGVLAGIIAAAIAIPLALDHHHNTPKRPHSP